MIRSTLKSSVDLVRGGGALTETLMVNPPPQNLYYQHQHNKPEMQAISAVLQMTILVLSLGIVEEGRVWFCRRRHQR